MLNLKKTAVAVLAFGSSAVFAGTMGPVCAPGNVTVPCASSAWDFGGQALYLQSSYSGHNYIGSTINGNTETYREIPSSWGWGFKLEGSYHFNTGNDLNLNWYHLDRTVNVGPTTVSRVFPGSSTTVPLADSLSGTAKPKWDAVNLEFGQLAHFGEWKNIRFHGGLAYVHIQNTLTSTGLYPAVAGVVPRANASESLKFNGVGPRVGLDYAYNWGNGLAMYANGATALFAGTQSFNDTLTHTGTTGGVPGHVTGSTTNVVPELEAKLGATYTYAMAQGDLSLDVGWMWVNYFNAVQNGTARGLGETHESNFAVQGPFIGLKWVGNVA